MIHRSSAASVHRPRCCHGRFVLAVSSVFFPRPPLGELPPTAFHSRLACRIDSAWEQVAVQVVPAPLRSEQEMDAETRHSRPTGFPRERREQQRFFYCNAFVSLAKRDETGPGQLTHWAALSPTWACARVEPSSRTEIYKCCMARSFLRKQKRSIADDMSHKSSLKPAALLEIEIGQDRRDQHGRKRHRIAVAEMQFRDMLEIHAVDRGDQSRRHQDH